MRPLPIPHRPRRARRTAAVLAGSVALLLLVPFGAAAQNTGTVRGTVTDAATTRPLVGTQVSIVGTGQGAITNGDGLYTITNVAPGEVTVRVESIGFRTVEETATVVVGQTATVDFMLEQDAIGLDAIVVTGTAGGAAKRTLGNSISTVNAAEITEVAPINNVQQLLQGRSAGVTLMSSSGVVGGSTKIRIRGASSLQAGNEPVVYVDGVRVSSGTLRTQGTTAQGISLLEAFNPADIESIEVIKGPAAATLYGAEAASGVIQIITKKGRPAGGLQWSANFDYGETEWATDKFATYWLCEDEHMEDSEDYPGCQAFDPGTPREDRLLVDYPLDPSRRSEGVEYLYDQLGLTEPYPCLYPQQQPCEPRPLRTGIMTNVNMSVRGGGEAYNFYISGERQKEDGTFFNNFNNRTGVRANFGFVPTPSANFNVNVGYVQLNQQTPLSDNSSNSILRNSNRGQAGGPKSQYLPGFRNFMPEFSNQYDNNVESERLTMGLTANYDPFSFWQNRLTIGLDRNDREQSAFEQIDQTGLFPNDLGDIEIDYDLVHLWTVDYAGTLSAGLTETLSSAFSAGMQLTKRREESHGIDGDGLVANQLNLVSAAANRSASQGFSEQTSLGFYVQEQLGWQDRLFGTVAVRVDDNSAFGRDFSLVVYPKASLAYVISEADFFNVGWVDELKLRGAWGQAGNAPEPFSADRTYETGRTSVGDEPANTLGTAAFGNPDLKAETGQEIELGFDASFLSGRIGTDFTYYYKQTKDALLSISDPPSSGWTDNHLVNIGEVKNSGIELTVNGAVIQRENLEWDVIASFATNANELVSFGRDAQGRPVLLEESFGEFLDVQRHREGYPLGGFWATDVVRDANGVPVLDEDGRATVEGCIWDPTQPELCNDEFLGPSLPTRTLGLTNTVRLFNNLQLFAFLDYQGGNWQWCAICSVRTRIDRNTQQINDPNLSEVERARLLSLQTKEFIYRGDFIKLRELSATYTIPRSLTERAGFSRASITLSGRNLWMWTKYEGGTDPEVAFNSTSSFGRTDYASVPMQRRLQVSLNFGF